MSWFSPSSCGPDSDAQACKPRAVIAGSTAGAAGPVADFVAGALGGVAICLLVQPFDTVKVILQSQPGRFASSFQCFKAVFNQSVRVSLV